MLGGFVKLKKIQKSEKNLEVGEAPTRILIFFRNFCVFRV